MEKKIKEYVSYYFRFDKTDEKEDKIAEITANLTERYFELLEKHQNEEKAYIETIKQMGDFEETNQSAKPEFSVKPSWVDISFIVSLIIAIFGALLTFFNVTASIVFTCASICLYAAIANYLYHLSQYYKQEEGDISKHNLILKKIFRNLKNQFVFWGVNLTFIISKLLISIILPLLPTPSLADIAIQIGIFGVIVLFLVLNILIAIIVSIILIIIYKRLMQNYYYLTGETKIDGYFKEAKTFLGKSEKPLLSPHLKIFILDIILIIFAIICLFGNSVYSFEFYTYDAFTHYTELYIFEIFQYNSNIYISIMIVLILISLIYIFAFTVIYIVCLIKKINIRIFRDILIYSSWFFCFINLIFVLIIKNNPRDYLKPYSSISKKIYLILSTQITFLILSSIVLVVYTIFKIKTSRKKE